MRTTDLRGEPVSTTDLASLDLLEQAVREYQSYVGDPIATIDRALETRPDFALGQAFKTAVLATFGEARYFEQARTSLAALEGLVERAAVNERERMHAAALRRLIDGDWHNASALFDRILIAYPRDAIALQTAHLFDFLRGDALNLRNRVSRVLPEWSRDVPGYSYVLGFHAFGLEECNQYDEAIAAAERALAIEPTDGWAVHAALHCMEMRGHVDAGIRWLETREAQWAPNNTFATHNYWHLALLYLDRADHARVLELFDQKIYPEPSVDGGYVLVDAAALLWRLHLLGVDVRSRAERVATVYERKLDGERGFYAFNDVHALLTFVLAQREELIARVMKDLSSTTIGSTANAAMAREIGLPVARGIVAYAMGRYAQCVEELGPVRDIAYRFGGSHAQRDLLSLTIISAALRSGQRQLARHYLNERVVHKPGSRLASYLR